MDSQGLIDLMNQVEEKGIGWDTVAGKDQGFPSGIVSLRIPDRCRSPSRKI
jgi:hypothetical protein